MEQIEDEMNDDQIRTSESVVYCTGPGTRMWKASSSDGQVVKTFQYNEALSKSMNSDAEPLNDSKSFNNKKDPSFRDAKNKSISHSFSLLYVTKIKNEFHHSTTFLITFNSIGVYVINLKEPSTVSFLRLARKGTSISKIVIDSPIKPVCQEKEENGIDINKSNEYEISHYRQSSFPMNSFPIYVITSRGFVKRHVILPYITESNETDNSFAYNNENTYGGIQADGLAQNVSALFSFSLNKINIE